MPRHLGRVPPIIARAVHRAHRQRRHVGVRQIVEARDRHRIIGTADLLDLAMAERRYAARLAKDMMRAVRTELIVGQRRGIAQQSKRLGLDLRAPVPFLGADRAIAFARPGIEIDVGLEFDGAAVARTMMGLEHLHPPVWRRRHPAPLPEGN